MITPEIISKTVFSILLKKENSTVKHIGTGFLIGNEGLFFTAGHTFRNIEGEIDANNLSNILVAFPSNNSKLYKIKSLWFDSLDLIFQKAPTYRDTAVGVIENLYSEFLVFNRKRPKIGDKLIVAGYYNARISKLHSYSNSIADLSEIQLNTFNCTVLENEALIAFQVEDYRTNNKNKIFNNCITVDNKITVGNSGCPVFDSKGLVIGICIGGPKFTLTTNILLSKYCTKIIRYKTYYKHDMYEDLNFR